MCSKTRGWPEERRLAQAERCRQNTPSAHSTGPKTEAGKAASSANSLKHGLHAADIRAIRKFLRAQKAFLDSL